MRRRDRELANDLTRALVAALALTACEPDEVLVASLVSDAGPPDGCRSNDDCNADSYCAKSDCAQPTGGCKLRPLVCDESFMPSCGCDGVNYWNDCLRQRSGAPSSVMGQCSTVVARCSDMSARECPVPGASCARLLPPNSLCMPTVSGVCWMLPDPCPPSGPSERWEPCGPGPRPCDNTCDAIRSGVPHHLHTGGAATCM